MQLVVSFSTLLASLFVALALVGDAEALPTKRNVGIVTLPMKRIAQDRSVHPQIVRGFHMYFVFTSVRMC